jgi:ribonuclease/clavin/mitogillin
MTQNTPHGIGISTTNEGMMRRGSTVSPIAKAASVLLLRPGAEAELFVVQRAQSLRFLGGFLAFPGGKVAAADRTLVPALLQEAKTLQEAMLERLVTAARELFEETGVLLARGSDGTFPAAGSVLRYLRRKLLAEDWLCEPPTSNFWAT